MALLFARCVNFKVFAEEYGVGKELARWEGGGGGLVENYSLGNISKSIYNWGLLYCSKNVVFYFSFGDKTEMFRPVMVEPSPEYLEATWK